VIQAFNTETKEYDKKGVGILKCNVDKTNGKGRILVRVEGTGKVILNQRIQSSTRFTKENKTMISFVGVNEDGTKPVKYIVKSRAEEQSALFTALEAAKST
jgi:hypothetical protein